ncbi:hypothetical protein ABZZ74_22055 [Streptomyces sp. NPDC006476]|uniref:hypothetical protein n=1 Tax=Streptomyces sp. NPDC006476 TaxID=3157175 RepID=UPI0033AFE340
MLRVTGRVFSTELGPDERVVGVNGLEGIVEFGCADGRNFSTAVAVGMTGRLIGVFCEGDGMWVWSFTYEGCDDADELEVAPSC